ncbi:MAG: hypothetical protein KDB80_02195 [Planctomycetes bacterium]|nr:hypothetical protein [Planctomycetota bacterium]
MNLFEHHRSDTLHQDDRHVDPTTAEDMLFAVDAEAAARYPYDDDDDSVSAAFDTGDFDADPMLGGFGSTPALMAEGLDEVVEDASESFGLGDRMAEFHAESFAPPPAPSPRVDAGPRQIPGRNRVSYSTGLKPASSTRLRPIEAGREPGAMSVLLPFTLFLTGTGGTVYYALLAGSPVLAGVSFTLGAIGAMFCRVLLRR